MSLYLLMPDLSAATTQNRTSLNSTLSYSDAPWSASPSLRLLQPHFWFPDSPLLCWSVLWKPARGHLCSYTRPLSTQPGLGQLTRASHRALPGLFSCSLCSSQLQSHTQSPLPLALFSLSWKSEFAKAQHHGRWGWNMGMLRGSTLVLIGTAGNVC